MIDAEYFAGMTMQGIIPLHFCFPATVISWKKSTNEAVVQPLFKMKEIDADEAEALSPIEIPYLCQRYEVHDSKAIDVFIPGALENQYSITYNEPVLFRPVLKKGDVVQCVVNQRNTDDMLGGTPYAPGKARMFNPVDAVIVGVIKFA